MSGDERERLRRLREQQLRARDPGPTVKVDWKGAKPKKQEPLLAEIWRTIPGRGKGLLFGFLFGVVFSIVVTGAMTTLMEMLAVEALPPAIVGPVCGGVFFIVALGMGAYLGKVTEDADTGI